MAVEYIESKAFLRKMFQTKTCLGFKKRLKRSIHWYVWPWVTLSRYKSLNFLNRTVYVSLHILVAFTKNDPFFKNTSDRKNLQWGIFHVVFQKQGLKKLWLIIGFISFMSLKKII